MTTPILIKSFLAAEAIGPHLIVKAGAADGQVNIGVDSEDPLLGVSDALGADAGKMADVTQVGWGEVKAGGTFAFGDQLTCDDEGRAIKAVPTAGKTIRTIGTAMAGAIENDIVPAHIVPGVIHTPA